MGPRRKTQAPPPKVPQANTPPKLALKGKRPIMQPQAWKQPRPVQQRRWIEPISQRHGRTQRRGISHEFSAPRTPQQNGVVERENRVLQEMARVMLLSNNVPRNLWAEAITTACYIGNRVFLRPGLETPPMSYGKARGQMLATSTLWKQMLHFE
ncbi:hypothetical protein LWI29_029275 [Acer saccharum]|uniref:Integrase catalytic domain-containing protein n=1 Tax=Acer saccharum TaxID=4024 RepID=A0AA39VWV7_ACESA|nr:hypothetical protein LWI29_029275 [Acer saccharum]